MNCESRFNILLVDDEPSNLHILNQILKKTYTVYAARYGRSAIKKACEDKPDLILLDVILPDMSGFEVLSELKKNNITQNIPVIFITGLTDTANERVGLKLGAVDYITKPFNSSVVKARVEAHLKVVEKIRIIEGYGMTDVLTQIPNRRNFEEQINVEWGRTVREKTPLSMMMIDVDRFKNFNDVFGHQQGDELLKVVAKTIKKTLKRATDLVFRWGGEEFAVLLPNTSLKNAMTVAEDIRSCIEGVKVHPDGMETFVTVSIGVSEASIEKFETVEDFISRADKALYLAKNTGRNKCMFIGKGGSTNVTCK